MTTSNEMDAMRAAAEAPRPKTDPEVGSGGAGDARVAAVLNDDWGDWRRTECVIEGPDSAGLYRIRHAPTGLCWGSWAGNFQDPHADPLCFMFFYDAPGSGRVSGTGEPADKILASIPDDARPSTHDSSPSSGSGTPRGDSPSPSAGAEAPGKASDAGALAVTFDAMLTAAGTLWRVLRSDGLVLDSDEHGFCTPDTVDRGGYCFVSREWAERHLKRWNKKQAKGEQSDAAVRPDPFDGGCPDDSERVADAFGIGTRASGAVPAAAPAPDRDTCEAFYRAGYSAAMCEAVAELHRAYPSSTTRGLLTVTMAEKGSNPPVPKSDSRA